jgi:hypothetical protein
MMTKILCVCILLSSLAVAQDGSEEAIILNQELQFLEETANNVTIISAPARATQDTAQPIQTDSLERMYFGNEEDNVNTRTAAPKRRRAVEF